MTIQTEKKITALQEGIKTVGVGRRGSRSLTIEQISRICDELYALKYDDAVCGAFFGALLSKGVDRAEMQAVTALTHRAELDLPKILEAIAPELDESICELCLKLMNGETLTLNESESLGDFFYSGSEENDGARALAASILRVRYETPEEYEGILKAMEKSFTDDWSQIQTARPLIQLAEPFDGVDHSNLITPLIAKNFIEQGFAVVSQCGRNSGPKFGNNLYDVAKNIEGKFLNASDQILENDHFGFYIDQKELSPELDRWVDIRRRIIKRPYLATLERFVNPLKSDYLIASAFHPQYGEKMITIAERAGFPRIIIIRNGLEGTMAFPLMRSAKILVSARASDGQYVRHEFDFNAATELNLDLKKEEKLENPSLDKNISLIKDYVEQGSSGYDLFDWRVQATKLGLAQAMKWIEKINPKKEGDN